MHNYGSSVVDNVRVLPVAHKQPAEHFRYYIVMQPSRRQDCERANQAARREIALEFTSLLKEWIKEEGLEHQVSGLNVTLFGQIMMTCAPAFIDHIRAQDMLGIDEIRPAQPLGHQLRRMLDQAAG